MIPPEKCGDALMADWDDPLVDAPAAPESRRASVPAATLTYTPENPETLPPEAADLFQRVRKAEGTAAGDGFVMYGGAPIKPGKDHPGSEVRVLGPHGPTSAAGPGQWEEATWNGLKPDFQKRFGREPDFSSISDQEKMVWLNAAKVYPGGENKLREDTAAGKLDTSKLAAQWEGFKAQGGWDSPLRTTQAGKWNVSPNALAFEQGDRK